MAKRSLPSPARARKAGASRRPGKAVDASIRYIESSALVAALLEHDTAAIGPRTPGIRYVTSALTFAESGRAIIRARAAGRLTAADEQAAVRALRTFERRCFVLDVNRAVLARVRRRFPLEPIRTLDAVHLATAEVLGESPQLVTVVSRDARVRENAQALGYVVA